MKRALVIVNPTSGQRQPLQSARRAAEHLEGAGWGVDVVVTEHAGHAVEIASQRGRGADMVVAVGGDGTLRETVLGLDGAPVPIGVVPAGNANVVARDLGIPQRSTGAVPVLTAGRPRTIDVGLVGDTIFLAMIGVGYDGWVTTGVGRMRAGPLGGRIYRRGGASLVYAVAGLPALFRVRPTKVEVCIDGNPCARRYPTLVISNTQTYALGWAMSPGADPSDGLLDHHLNRRTAPWFVVWTLLAAVAHRRLPRFVAEYGSARRYRLRAERPFYWQVDGDPMPPVTELELEVAPRRARIMVPR